MTPGPRKCIFSAMGECNDECSSTTIGETELRGCRHWSQSTPLLLRNVMDQVDDSKKPKK